MTPDVEARLQFEQRSGGNGHIEKALRSYEQSAALEARIEPRNRERILNNDIGAVLLSMGRYKEAVRHLREKTDRLERARDVFNLIVSEILLADALRMSGAPDDALAAGEKALALAKKTGLGRWRLFAHEVLANIHHDADRFAQAIDEDLSCLAASACLENADEHRAHTMRLWLHMGHCHLEMHAWDKAIMHFETVLNSEPPPLFRMIAEGWLGETLFHKGDTDEALNHIDRADELSAGLAEALIAPYMFRFIAIKVEILIGQRSMDSARSLLPRMKIFAGNDKKLIAEYDGIERKLK